MHLYYIIPWFSKAAIVTINSNNVEFKLHLKSIMEYYLQKHLGTVIQDGHYDNICQMYLILSIL